VCVCLCVCVSVYVCECDVGVGDHSCRSTQLLLGVSRKDLEQDDEKRQGVAECCAP